MLAPPPEIPHVFAIRVILGICALILGCAFALMKFDALPAVDALYFSVIVATTTGFGDILPATWPSRVVVSLLGCAGLGLVGALAGDVVSSWAETRASPGAGSLRLGGAGRGAIWGGRDTPRWGVARALAALNAPRRFLRRKIRLVLPQRWQRTVAIILSLFGVGTVSFAALEGLSLPMAGYLAVSTLTTVGLGDLSPATAGGRIFTVVYALLGCATLGRVLGTLALQPLEKERQRQQRSVIDFYRDIGPATFNELASGALVKRLGLSIDDDYITRNEFTILLLLQQGKISQEDLDNCRSTFALLDVDASGKLCQRDMEMLPSAVQRIMDL